MFEEFWMALCSTTFKRCYRNAHWDVYEENQIIIIWLRKIKTLKTIVNALTKTNVVAHALPIFLWLGGKSTDWENYFDCLLIIFKANTHWCLFIYFLFDFPHWWGVFKRGGGCSLFFWKGFLENKKEKYFFKK